MSWGKVVGLSVVGLVSIVIGKLWGASQERKAHEHLYEENKELRTEREALISFLENHSYQYEKIVAEIYNIKPKSKAELRELLTCYSLSNKEIERVNSMLVETGFYTVRAA